VKQDSTTSPHIHLAGYLVGFGFLALAVAMLALSPMVKVPIEPPVRVLRTQIVPGAWRENLTDPPTIKIGTLVQRCNDCHALFKNIREEDRQLTQHTHIELRHGTNDACLNCHDHRDRERLTLRGGDTVGYGSVEQLCAQCHGPIYRDWQSGAHGKTVGFWDRDQGDPIKLTCSQCHDPHSPAFAPIEPLPGPRTLRMGDQSSSHAAGAVDPENPLQMWHLEGAGGHGAPSHEEGTHE